MFKKIVLLFLSFLTLNVSFAISTGENTNTSTGNCENIKQWFKISWPDFTKISYPTKFEVENVKNVSWSIYKNNQKVFTTNSTLFLYSFQKPGNVIISANFSYKNCNIQLEKKVNIYNKFVLLIKDEEVSFIPYDKLKEKGILIIKYNDIKIPEQIIDMSDFILLDKKFAIDFFSNLDKTKKYNNKKFVIFISNYKSFFSKLIIPYIKWIYYNNIYLYSKQSFLNVLEDIYLWKDFKKENLLTPSNIKDKIYFPLSYFVNKLIEHGIDIKIIQLVLVVLVWTMIVAIFRQFIWFSVFGVYTPLLFTILIVLAGYNIVLFLFILSILANIITFFITKKIYILYSSKIALNYIIYVIISIIFTWLFMKYNIVNIQAITNTTLLIFFMMPLLSKNLVKEETNIFSKSFWIFILEFTIISSILLIIFKWDFLKYILISYPDLLWLLAILTIIIGRFSGLQLLEYIRFYPLIKKWMYEEEE